MIPPPYLLGNAVLIFALTVLFLSQVLYVDARRNKHRIEATLTRSQKPQPTNALDALLMAAGEGVDEAVQAMIFLFQIFLLPAAIIILWSVIVVQLKPDALDIFHFIIAFPLTLAPGVFLASIVPFGLSFFSFASGRNLRRCAGPGAYHAWNGHVLSWVTRELLWKYSHFNGNRSSTRAAPVSRKIT
jgi:hypothetical protein